ncbi:MAG: hypothetical protein ACTSYO_06400 [Candidatus Ranarchaeia archaeon]
MDQPRASETFYSITNDYTSPSSVGGSSVIEGIAQGFNLTDGDVNLTRVWVYVSTDSDYSDSSPVFVRLQSNYSTYATMGKSSDIYGTGSSSNTVWQSGPIGAILYNYTLYYLVLNGTNATRAVRWYSRSQAGQFDSRNYVFGTWGTVDSEYSLNMTYIVWDNGKQ